MKPVDDEFGEYWRANFPDCPPVSFTFKVRLNHRWFRIHSLPESKRYAETAEESQEILRRQRMLFNDVIGGNEICYLVCLSYKKIAAKAYETECPSLARLLTHASAPVQIPEIQAEREDDEFFQVGFGKQNITFDGLKEILAAVADYRTAYFFVLNPNSKRIFAPYDGGVDVILENSEKRDQFKYKYKNWLSSHPQGY